MPDWARLAVMATLAYWLPRSRCKTTLGDVLLLELGRVFLLRYLLHFSFFQSRC
jgi:hypothetical protein